MKKVLQYMFVALMGTFFFACEDVISVDLNEGASQLNVDAWIDNRPQPQTIKLTKTKAYFDNSAPEPVLDAIVTVRDTSGEVFLFQDSNRDGNYIWEPQNGESFGRIGQQYILSIETGEELYLATSSMNRVPPIDSITYTFEEEALGTPEGYYAEFFARDIPGQGDCYWIKTYKNGVFLNKPEEINIAYDAGFSAGGNVDGLIFVPPIRFSINRIADSGDDAVDTSDLPPYEVGDSIYVELYSIPLDAFYFLSEARTQMTNEGLFASPLANVPSNIFNSDETAEIDRQAVGYFTVSAVRALGTKVAP